MSTAEPTGDSPGSEQQEGADEHAPTELASTLFRAPARSTEERLTALGETIRSWDWRADRPNDGDRTVTPPQPTRTTPFARNWALAGAAVVVVVIAVVVAIAVGSSSVHPSAPARPTQSSTAQAAAQAQGLTRLRAATVTATSAGTAVSHGFATLQGLPTVATVSTVINPYLAALQSYQDIMATTPLPSSVTRSARAVGSQLESIISFLRTIDSIDPIALGTWINNYYLHTAELQSAIIALQNVLPNPATAA